MADIMEHLESLLMESEESFTAKINGIVQEEKQKVEFNKSVNLPER